MLDRDKLINMSKSTLFQNTIDVNRNEEFFKHRSGQLKRLKSYHLFPIETCGLGEHPMIIYKLDALKLSLQDLIDRQLPLTPTHLKGLVWQVAKFMLSCEEEAVNHCRLIPKSILLAQEVQKDRFPFIYIKDFSMGKQFETVKQGKVQQIFEYLHPSLSINNQFMEFDVYKPRLDIWSLGIILFRLVYFRHPFCKPGKSIFSKTILREYMAGSYVIEYSSNDHWEANRFIGKCLSQESQRFRTWKEVKQFLVTMEDVYNQLDFHDGNFEEMARIHIKFMIFASLLYCLIIDECRESPSAFWKIPISKERRIPFQVQIAEFTLALMHLVSQRFYQLYDTHIFLLKATTKAALRTIKEKLENELKFKAGKWIEPRLGERVLSREMINLMQDICVRLKVEVSQGSEQAQLSRRVSREQQFDSQRLSEMRSSLVRKNSKGKGRRQESRLWKNVQILLDYCSEVLPIISANARRENSKFIFEELYTNTVFDSILTDEFHFVSDLSDIFKKIYKDYLEP